MEYFITNDVKDATALINAVESAKKDHPVITWFNETEYAVISSYESSKPYLDSEASLNAIGLDDEGNLTRAFFSFNDGATIFENDYLRDRNYLNYTATLQLWVLNNVFDDEFYIDEYNQALKDFFTENTVPEIVNAIDSEGFSLELLTVIAIWVAGNENLIEMLESENLSNVEIAVNIIRSIL